MRKYIFKLTLMTALVSPLLTGCELDQYPDGITNDNAFITLKDAEGFDNGLYGDFRSASAQGWTTLDMIVDYYQPGLGYGNRGGDAYRWEFVADDFGGIWKKNYSAISNANNVISRIGNVHVSDSVGKAELELIKGDTYFARAAAYANMVMGYCKAYNPETADKDLGLPLVTKVDINEKPARSSLKATMDFIMSDLAEAKKRITNTDLGNAKFTVYLVNALQARMELWRKNYAEALSAAKKVIESGKFALAKNGDDFAQMWVSDQGSEFIFVPVQSAPNERGFNWAGLSRYNSVVNAYEPDYLISQSTLDLYDDMDWRKQIFFDANKVVENDQSADNIFLLNKYPGNPALKQEGDSPYDRYNAPKPYRLAELYLIAAESELGLSNVAEALKYVNDLRQARGLNALPASTSADALMTEIKNEWKKEFIGEGKYFYCLKRWGEGFKRDPQAQNENIIFSLNPERSIALEIKPDNKRWLFEIPTNDITTNKNLIKNW